VGSGVYLAAMEKIFFLLGCLLVLGSASVRAQTTPEVVVVRVVEDLSEIRLLVARNGGPENLIKFRAGNNEKDMRSAGVGVQKVIQQLYQEGYSLQSTFGGGNAGAGTYQYSASTLIFVKAPKP